MSYVDGFLVPVRHDQRAAYVEVATAAAQIFRDLGALAVVECWGDDIPDGKVTDFRRAVAAEADETVVFSWIVWPSREIRDAGNARMMADNPMKDMAMPFDGKRMVFGGFATIVDTAAD
ncbi:MAG: DUF1428 domain-containing protein [Alphaproteobacteria bacterium]|nr:MAG: DUF1428 domain-containing protein [Alphaproteobacteria bacterium]